MQTNGGALLNGVTLPPSGSTYNVSGGTTQLEGTITNNGTFTIPNGTLQIVGAAVTSLTGGGTVQMCRMMRLLQSELRRPDAAQRRQRHRGVGASLGQNGMALDNQSAGTVNANVDGGTLFLNGGGTVTNDGTLEASNGGTMTVSNPSPRQPMSAGTITGHLYRRRHRCRPVPICRSMRSEVPPVARSPRSATAPSCRASPSTAPTPIRNSPMAVARMRWHSAPSTTECQPHAAGRLRDNHAGRLEQRRDQGRSATPHSPTPALPTRVC